jgi:serine protease AprX
MQKHTSRIKRILLSCLIVICWVSGTSQSPLEAQIDPRVWDDTSGGKIAHFLVVFKQQRSQLSSAINRIPDDVQARQLVSDLRTKAEHSQQTARAYLNKNDIQYTPYWVANIIAVEGNRQVVEALARLADVLLIEPDRTFTADLEVEDSAAESLQAYLAPGAVESGISQVHAPQVWALGQTGVGTVYAVADTGVYWQHAALINQYRGWNGASASHDYNWWDAIREDINPSTNECGYDVLYPCDDYGHGTHVVGTGVGDDGAGNQIGMAPGARWIGCRNMDDGIGRPSTYIECLQFFIAPTDLSGDNPNPDLRPDVISNSYGCPASELCEAHSLQLALEAVRAAGIFMSVSAGNSGPGCQTIGDPPALEASVFTIGAVNSSNTIASFSSRGPVTVDGSPLMKPDLVAPGVSIRSSLYTDGYGYKSGTSMAAPHVAGAVALLWGAYPSLRRNVDMTEDLLAITAQHLTTTQGCGSDGATQVPNNVYGWGLLDVKAAYDVYALMHTEATFPLIYK